MVFPFAANGSASTTFSAARRCGGKLRLKWFAHVFSFFGSLLGELLGDASVVTVQILAAQAEAYQREKHECISSHGYRPLPGASFDATIQKRKRQNRQDEDGWNYKDADD